MPIEIKIIRQEDDLYTAEVIASNGTWRLPHPLPSFELIGKLFRLGHSRFEIERAFWEARVDRSPDATYSYVAKITRPFLLAALAGEREVPEQRPFTEAWLAYALFMHEGLRSLEEVIGSVDAENHDIPNSDEISWAFLRLRRRGWLAVEGELYGLTPEGYRAVQEIEDRGEPTWPGKKIEGWISYVTTGQSVFSRMTWPIKKLEDWISKNPPPSEE